MSRPSADPRNAERIEGTWLARYTVTKVEGIPYAAAVGQSYGSRWTITPKCQVGSCDAAVSAFGFSDGQSGERTLTYGDAAYRFSDSGEQVTCYEGGIESTDFENIWTGILKVTSLQPDGSGAGQLTGTYTWTGIPRGKSAAAGCGPFTVEETLTLPRTTPVTAPVHDVPAGLQVLRSFGQAAGLDFVAVVEVKNASTAPIRLGLSSSVLHSNIDDRVLVSKFAPNQPNQLVGYPTVLSPNEIGY